MSERAPACTWVKETREERLEPNSKAAFKIFQFAVIPSAQHVILLYFVVLFSKPQQKLKSL
jgi:hypothetical protein